MLYFDGTKYLGHFGSPGECFLHLVPTYTFTNWENLLFCYKWNQKQVDQVLNLDLLKAVKREESYIDSKEIVRVKKKLETKTSASIRFGVEKEGRGWHNEERGDFCLVGGSCDKKKKELTMFYRSLDMIGGFNWDLSIPQRLIEEGIIIKKVTVYARNARAFAKKGNSNEKFYHQLKEIYGTTS